MLSKFPFAMRDKMAACDTAGRSSAGGSQQEDIVGAEGRGLGAKVIVVRFTKLSWSRQARFRKRGIQGDQWPWAWRTRGWQGCGHRSDVAQNGLEKSRVLRAVLGARRVLDIWVGTSGR